MTPHSDEYLELCAGYALGNLTETEQKTVEAHLEEGCPTCEVELDRLGRGVWAFASATPRLLEPPTLRTKVMGSLRSDPTRRAPIPLPRRRRAPIIAWVTAAAAVALAFFGWREYQEVKRLDRDLVAARDEVAKLRAEVQDEREWSSVLSAPQARVVELMPTPDGSSQLRARVAYDPASRRGVVAVADFTAPPGKDYQLWALTKSGPSSLGLVRPDPTGRALIRLPNAGDPFTLTAFAVSLEAAGGSPNPSAPSGPVVMMGKVGG